MKTLLVDASTYPTDGASVGNHYLLLALQLELLGTEKQLMYSMDAALEAFEWYPNLQWIFPDLIHTYIHTHHSTMCNTILI